MRLVRYTNGNQIGIGVQADGATYFTGYTDMIGFIEDGDRALERASQAIAERPVAYDRLLAPIAKPGKIFGSGVNYRSHGDEEPGFVFPDEPPIGFVKLSSALIGPGEPIVLPPHNKVIKRANGFDVDYEVEFGVVIGRRCQDVPQADALAHVFGYTLFNDVSSRAVQFKNNQVDLGKGFDTFAPMGPAIITADEFPNPGLAHIQSLVNGQIRQDALVSELIWPIPVMIEWISSVATLDPGDCISTGTPAGCGTFMNPPQYLKPGDVVTVREDTIGELTNPVVAR